MEKLMTGGNDPSEMRRPKIQLVKLGAEIEWSRGYIHITLLINGSAGTYVGNVLRIGWRHQSENVHYIYIFC